MNEKYFVGKYTIIGEDVEIGEGSKIWHFCNLFGGKIGKNTQIGCFCEFKRGFEIGDDCRLQAYVVGEDVKIGNKVFIGPQVVFVDDKYPTAEKTIKGTFKKELVIVEDDVTIGGNCVILPGIKIGQGAVIGAGSVVTKDVPAYAVVYGNPARVVGDVRDEKYKGKV